MQREMATCSSSSKPSVWLRSQRESWLSGARRFQAFNVGARAKSCACMWRSETGKRAAAEFVVRGCGERDQNRRDGYGSADEDQEFVNVLREAQPYISIHRDSVFVLLISAEIIASPHLDAILKGMAGMFYLDEISPPS